MAIRLLGRIATIIFVASTTSACAASGTLPSTTRHVSSRELTMEKTGRVVDANTGVGIPGVKVIVNWQTLSSGVPGYSSTGGTWCDLQKIVTTDADGNYTIPDVSKELDISDRGTRIGKTPYGLASATHDKNYVLAVYKPGYVRAVDMEKIQKTRENAQKHIPITLLVPETPAVSFRGGKVSIDPVTMRKQDLVWSDLLAYDTWVSSETTCSSRMAYSIEQPEWHEMRKAMQDAVRALPCAMPPGTTIQPRDFAAFWNLSHSPATQGKFYERVKELQGLPRSPHGYDPTEQITTTAGVLCRALQEEDAAK
jgi:hypothetical protein